MDLTPNGMRLLTFLGTLITIIVGCSLLYAQLVVQAERQIENGKKLDDIKLTIVQLKNETKDKNDEQDKKLEEHLKNLVRLDAFLSLPSL